MAGFLTARGMLSQRWGCFAIYGRLAAGEAIYDLGFLIDDVLARCMPPFHIINHTS
jgi:hypothetical protein